MQELSDMLPCPPLLSRPIHKRLENHVQVELQQTLLDIDSHAVIDPALVRGTPQISRFERNLHL